MIRGCARRVEPERKCAMYRIVAVTGLSLLNLIAAFAHGDDAAVPEAAPRPKVYMLVAAVGEQFTAMIQTQGTGTRLPPYRKISVKVKDNVLNRYVLHSLDKAIAETDPDSKRLFMILRATDMDAASPSEREKIALDGIVSDLKGMPEREEWDSIIVATPAYKAFEFNGVAGRLAGLGVFYQPLGGSNFYDMLGGGMGPYTFGEQGAGEVVTPEGKTIRSYRYTAPFSFIDIWVLDPKTLAVLDKQQRFDHIKLAEQFPDSLRITQDVSPKVLMDRFSRLVERSVEAAVTHSEMLSKHGVVEVGKIREVKPEDKQK